MTETDAPGAGAQRPRVSSLAAVTLLTGLLIVAALSWISFRTNEHEEAKLLELKVREVGAVLTQALPTIQTPLASAAEIAAITDGSASSFDEFMSPDVGPKATFVSASLWRVTPRGPKMLIDLGRQPAFARHPKELASFFARSEATPLLTVIGALSGSYPVLGYAYTPAHSDAFVVYAESAIPIDRRVPISASSPFADLNFALYLGSGPEPANLLETTSDQLPIPGATKSVTVAFGHARLTLVASAIGNLGGSLPADLPWIIAVSGLVLSILAALVAERLVRRRRRAEQLAAENRSLYREQRGIAESLQRALLPEELPRVPGIEMGARYVAGAEGVDIGGDWYDVIPVGPDRFMFVVGDVSGRGIRAATVMARLHFAIRAYVADGDDPATIVSKLSRLIDVSEDGHFATMLCGSIDVTAARAHARQRRPSLPSAGRGGTTRVSECADRPTRRRRI